MDVKFIDIVSYNSKFARAGGAVLFYVPPPGRGDSIKIRYGKDKDGALHSFVLAGAAPLFKWRSCKKTTGFQAGAGRGAIEGDLLDKIISQCGLANDLNIRAAYELSLNLLGALEPGFYLLAFNDHFPASINGGFFGELAANDYTYYKFNYPASKPPAFPAYLIPTTAPAACDILKIKYYRGLIKNGAAIFATALYFDDFMSVLLKGHHKAAAAYLEGRKITCLTIIPCSGYAHDNKNITTLFFGSDQIEAANIDGDYLPELIKIKGDKILNEDETQKNAAVISGEWNVKHNILNDALYDASDGSAGDLSDTLSGDSSGDAPGGKPVTPPVYESFKIIEGFSILGELNDTRIEALLNSPSPDYNAVEIALDMLIETNDSRAYDFACRIAGSETYIGLWATAFTYLARFKNKEVEDLFINYLINDECAVADVTRTVDNYLEEVNN
jgi:hypothetical protein